MAKFFRYCEHCQKEIVKEHNGRKVYGHFKPLCDECEAAHEAAQGVYCRTCGKELDEIDAPYFLCWQHQRWKDSEINPHTWKPETQY